MKLKHQIFGAFLFLIVTTLLLNRNRFFDEKKCIKTLNTPKQYTIDDVTITIKSSNQSQFLKRVDVLLDTWVKRVLNQVFFNSFRFEFIRNWILLKRFCHIQVQCSSGILKLFCCSYPFSGQIKLLCGLIFSYPLMFNLIPQMVRIPQV